MANSKVEIVFQSIYENVSMACDKFRQFCIENEISKNIYLKLEICLTEALNNVIKHSYLGQPGNEIKLIVQISNSMLELIIIETGLPRKKTGKPTLEFDPTDIDNLPEGGMGLFIIEEIMDETNYKSDGKTNTFTMFKQL
ncbi:MAG: ATP-binding protein [Bacteroidetes bacterium]|nr:ATP-binding protein [Bacteroidota bacterium]